MQRPGWATVLAVFFIITALFGISSAIGDINVHNHDIKIESESKNAPLPDSSDLEIIGMFGDSIIVDSEGKVNLESTMKSFMKISDYRKSWMIKFGYISILLCSLFLISGLLLLNKHKLTIPLSLLTLSLGIAFAIFKLMIYGQDTDTGKFLSMGEDIGNYFGIFYYIILLIVLLVCDRTYYNMETAKEDYYDGNKL